MEGGSGWGRGQGGCEWRSEAFVKIQIVFVFFLWGGGGGVGLGGGQGVWEWRSEAFVKIQKKNLGGGGGGVEGPIRGWGGGGSKVWVRW